MKTAFSAKDGAAVLTRLPQVDSIGDGPGKPFKIGRFVGKSRLRRRQLRQPPADAGVRDVGDGPRLAVLVHHTDAEREYNYYRDSKTGELDEANAKHWVVMDMKSDWKNIFPAVGL